MSARLAFILSLVWLSAAIPASAQEPDPLAWPAVTQTARPWTRWWWHGSAVDEANITRLLETYKAAGLGGVEITCIYGVRGAEDRVRRYLSPEWLAAVRHTLREAKRLGLGVDLPTGSGWRMGGPSVTDADANAAVVIRNEPLAGGQIFEREYASSLPQAVVAYGPDGQVVDLLEEVSPDGRLEWQVPEEGEWTLYTVTQRWSRDSVKRPAPGGEGKNINPYSLRSLGNYLEHFTRAIGDLPDEGIRAQFHDSFEYEGNWCDNFLAEFVKRRGYKLQQHLPALDGRGDPDTVARVKHDYRETLSDLVLENLIEPWAAWSHAKGMLARNQSHGSPANWLDLYAAVDIPETESFGQLVGGDGHPLVFKFASSAAHVAGRPLVSSETATWLDEHFHVTLGQIKEMVDRQLLAGVNHVVYHGTAYSPADAAWPGWVFYASTQLNPQNPIWRDLPALNAYVTRCQSILQTTKPDNDVLLYWPIHDLWQNPRGLRMDFRVHNARDWLLETPFGRFAQWLDEHGYTFDYISDRQIAQCDVTDGRITTPGGEYAVIVVPEGQYLPLKTLQNLMKLADAGATILFANRLPTGAPGLTTDEGRAAWEAAAAPLRAELTGPPQDSESSATWLQEVNIGRGRAVLSSDWSALLATANVQREAWREPARLNFIRQSWPDGHVYLIKNEGEAAFDGWIAPAVDWHSAALFDPLTGNSGGTAVRTTDDGTRQIRVQLAAGQTLFLKTFRQPTVFQWPAWTYHESHPSIEPQVTGGWSVEFIAGGPELPPAQTIERLNSWTNFAGEAGERFAGTARYSATFQSPGDGRYRLDLGQVADSARVGVNGQPVATLITAPYVVDVDLRAGENRLVVEVTNVAANRVRDLDRRRVRWKIFEDINIVNINYRPFNAARWPVREAGLLGPVTIQPLTTMQ